MATNPPKGDGHRNGAVKQRYQTYNPKTEIWTKRDTNTGKFMDGKKDGTRFNRVCKIKQFCNKRGVFVSRYIRVQTEGHNMSSESNNKIETGNRIVKYAQEHAAGLTLLATLSITVGSVLLKYIYYLIELAYVNYFNISPSYINIADDNILYGIVANGVMALFFALISSLPYWIWQSKLKTFCKIVWMVLITLVPEFLLVFSLVRLAFQGITYSVGQYIWVVIIGIFFGLAIFSIGYLLIFDKRKSKKEKSKDELTKKPLFERVKRTIVAFLILVVLESVVIYVGGCVKAASQNQFKIIEATKENSYVILYETDSNYIVAECEIIGNKISIDKTEHKQISKENTEYSVKQLTQIVE